MADWILSVILWLLIELGEVKLSLDQLPIALKTIIELYQFNHDKKRTLFAIVTIRNVHTVIFDFTVNTLHLFGVCFSASYDQTEMCAMRP